MSVIGTIDDEQASGSLECRQQVMHFIRAFGASGEDRTLLSQGLVLEKT